MYFDTSWQLKFGVVRVLNILVSVVFIVMLVLNNTFVVSELFNIVTIILGCIVAVLNIVNTIIGYNTAAKGKMDAWQLSWFNRLHPGD